ncbi:MAG: hypothetical protein AAGA30_11810, partial [Planctomycetota bacterium]
MNKHRLFIVFVSLTMLWLAGCEEKPLKTIKRADIRPSKDQQAVASIIDSEDLVLDLTPKLHDLAGMLKRKGSFTLNDLQKSSVLSPSKTQLDQVLKTIKGLPGLRSASIPVAAMKAEMALDPWDTFNAQIEKWETAKFGVKSAKFTDNQNKNFELNTAFSGRAFGKGGEIIGVKAKQKIVFANSNSQWKLTGWE